MESYTQVFIIFYIVTFLSNIRSVTIDCDPGVHLYLQEGSQLKLGRGDNPNDIPSIECISLHEQVLLNCTMNVRSEKHNCNLVLSGDDGMTIKVDSLYQFSNNKVIVVWRQLKSDIKEFTRQITTVDIDNCENMTTLTFPKYSNNWHDLQVIVLYNDSFDAIAAYKEGQRTRISYDLSGNEIETSSVLAGSIQHGYGNKQVKDVLTFYNNEFKEQRVTCTESNKFNTICAQQNGNDSRSFFCVQMGGGKPMYRRELHLPENTQIIGVRNFKEGGMMLFGLESESKLIVAEIRLGHRPKILSVKLKWPINKLESAVVDFREIRNDLYFTLIGETDEFNHSVVMQYFRLSDRNTRHHRRRS